MSQTAKGTVVANQQDGFQATFTTADGFTRTFSATINPTVGEFKIDNARLAYNDEDQLTGTDNYYGTIGTDLNITLGKGPTITGRLVIPIDPTNSINGSGPWGMSS
ncbi:uncharacterized protein PHACADRAFT_199982 [Phanerochaete carnosa HHB-10118-sp]|uniref:Uncharacterized protein n=1 Tax=Phanerochaete carnosa (strain HHB-10118-sp) TaxID=650164 RepID=K5VX15_PHACS|nr:uncharacterized protein PHACADRAFT_199982 [Phanerochaete carnosa HHB-10118-sp]EKM51149.1 hypothetical protein PHACADRAFT_199982 [Phanerochaete carnosa HHB-10118-sp]